MLHRMHLLQWSSTALPMLSSSSVHEKSLSFATLAPPPPPDALSNVQNLNLKVLMFQVSHTVIFLFPFCNKLVDIKCYINVMIKNLYLCCNSRLVAIGNLFLWLLVHSNF